MIPSKLLVRSWAIAALLAAGLSSSALAATVTWTGAIDNLWSNSGNWAGGAPNPGDRIAFPVSASNPSTVNDLPASNVYFDITFLGNGYTIGGNTVALSDGIPGNNGMFNVINANLQLTAAQSISGSFCCGGLTLAGAVDIGANAVTIARATVTGVISGTGTVTLGDVTTFSGNNTYTGLTIVTQRGQFDGSQPSSSVQNNGNLSGIGTVGPVSNSNELTPGQGFGGGIGILTIAGNLDFNNNSYYNVQLYGPTAGTGYDQVIVNGGVTLTGNVSLYTSLNYSPSTGQVLTLIDNDGIDPVIGSFTGLPEGAIITMNASDFQISYVGGSGNDVTLTVTAAAKTWTGAVNNLWSVAGNWQGGVPGAGDPLVFPNGASNLSNTNDLPTVTYKLMLFTGGGYTIGGNAIGLSNGIPGTNSGINNTVNADLQLTAPQTLSGSFCCGGLTLAGSVAIGANAVTIERATVTGVISGTGPVTTGDVTTFSGNNTYTGLTTVTQRGQFDGNQPSSSVQNNGNLSGIGTVGPVSNSNELTPGQGFGGAPGKLTIMGNLSFTGGYYNVQLNGSLPGAGYDQVVVNGGVTLGSNPSLYVSLGFTPSLGQIFVITLNDGVDPVSGTFNGLPQGSTFNIGPYPFEVSYIGKTGNEIILTSLSGDPLNNAPVAVSDSYATPQNTGLSIGAPGVLVNDSDADFDAITVVQPPTSTTKGGTLTLNPDGSFLYQPPVGFVGFDDFTYIISDGNDATDLATVTIEVQDLQAPSVTVNAPNGGEVLIVGGTAKLDWTVTDKKPVTVDLWISRDNGSNYDQIADDIANTGTYTWTVTAPGTNPGVAPVFSALFKVEARDSSNNVDLDVSDAPFAIHDLTTPTLLSTFHLAATVEGLELRWQLAEPSEFTRLAIERAESEAGPWIEVDLERRDEGELTVAIDRTVAPQRTYFYRLVGTTAASPRVLLGELSGVAERMITELAIARVAPNPSHGPMRIEFALPRESRVRLSVLDIQGREVALLTNGILRAGLHQATWSGETDRGDAPAGVYFVRCRALGKQLTERIVRTK